MEPLAHGEVQELEFTIRVGRTLRSIAVRAVAAVVVILQLVTRVEMVAVRELMSSYT
jgi:hypothetical protein